MICASVLNVSTRSTPFNTIGGIEVHDMFGNETGQVHYFVGALDEVRIYDCVLTAN